MKFTKLQGIIIKEINTGEADKIITIFSKRLGKIQALAKGARRPQSRHIAGTQFLSFSDFVLFKGKDMYNVQSCDIIESFYDIRHSLKKITYASHIADIVNQVSEEHLSYPKLLQLLLNTLHVLTNTSKSPELISRIFEIRLMTIVGYTPQVTECAKCGRENSGNIFFNSKLGGIVCESCGGLHKGTIKISQSTLSALRYIIFSDMKKLFSFNVSPSVLSELKLVSEDFLLTHINKSFDKLKFLNDLNAGESGDD